jgi:lipopolysaccharide export system protein LptA
MCYILTRMKRIFIPALLLLVVSSSLQSQTQKKKTIELLHANSLEFDKRLGVDAKRLLGNVSFKDNNTIMYCDSAYLYNNNSADAFGHIHITQGDSVNAYGDLLKYDGNTKMAELHNNVRLVDKDMTLTSNVLFFDTKNNTATYHGGGTIVSKENTLTSDNGYYYTHSKELAFKKNVVLINPRYTMNSDTLNYNTASKVTHFLGPTTIKSQQDFIYCENGFYNTVTDVAQFKKNAYLISKNQRLKGDSLYYDKKIGVGKGFKNISITDTSQNITITGDYSYSNELTNVAIVTGNAVMSQVNAKDTLFIHADSLRAENENKRIGNSQERIGNEKIKNKNVKLKTDTTQISNLKSHVSNLNPDTTTYRILKAYHKVKIFKSDLQGKCDSLVYSYRDSVMRMFREPVLWSQKNQLTAEHIELKTSKGALQSLLLTNSAFIISQVDSLRFNQIKGKVMHGYFANNQLHKIRVEGNGQTIYYGKDKNKYIGVNKAECSDLLIFLKDSQVDKITFITKPDATLFPIKELPPADLLLKDFVWRIKQRPNSFKDIFFW